MNKIDSPLVNPGRSHIRTKEPYAANKVISLTEAAEYTRKINTPESLREHFLKEPALYEKKLRSGAVVRTHVATGAYSPGAVQITAIRPEIVKNINIHLIDGRIPTLTIYDFSQDAQQEYFAQILAGLKIIKREFANYAKTDFIPIFTENAACTVSNEKSRLARTIAEPHSQIWIATSQTIPLDQGDISSLQQRERSITKILWQEIGNGARTLQGKLNSLQRHGYGFGVRDAPPFGYVITTPIDVESMPLTTETKMLTELMNLHHRQYSKTAQSLSEILDSSNLETMKKKLLPQPSYKVYGIIARDGRLEISISPTIFAETGVIEALDRRISRDPLNTAFFNSDDAEALYYYDISKKLEIAHAQINR